MLLTFGIKLLCHHNTKLEMVVANKNANQLKSQDFFLPPKVL